MRGSRDTNLSRRSADGASFSFHPADIHVDISVAHVSG